MSAYTQRVRALFIERSPREQILALAIVLVLALWWASSEIATWQSFWTTYRSQGYNLERQNEWLKDRERIDAELVAALETLDASQTYSDSELAGRVDELSRSFDLSYSISNRPSVTNEDFNTHSVRLNINRAELRPLIEFTQSLQREAPYLVIDSVRITVNRSRPTEHNATFTLSSFELKAL
ncbi:MAG: hypothetical protein MK080_05575 [Opitutales bacterium]|nr:hypothetical protein [Opitutales bacterium]NRA27160.1 hypothetical protein [Opitutales bacterium]